MEWGEVKAHLLGVWHSGNRSRDLIHLNQEIRNIQEARDPIINPAQVAQVELLSELKGFNPFDLLKHTTRYTGGTCACDFNLTLCFFISRPTSWKGAPANSPRIALPAFRKEKRGPGGALFSDGETMTLNMVSAFIL